MNPDPDYSAAYLIIETDNELEGHGLTFTIGRGNELCISAFYALEPLIVGLDLSWIIENMGRFWRHITGDSQLRWVGPDKGILHLATGAVVNAVWDLWSKSEKKPVWRLVYDMSPEEIVSLIDFRYLTDAVKPEEALNYGIRNLEICFEGINNPKIEKIMHMCCGYPDKLDAINYPKAPLDSYKKISKQLDSSILDAISIEDAHRYNDEEIFENFKNKKLILGLIKIASSKEETEQEIEQRIKAVLRYIDKERLIAAPDCGLGFLPRELAIKKLTTMVNAARKFI